MSYSLPVLAYHKVESRRELGITSLSPQRFEKQIRLLKHEGYMGISSQEILSFNKVYDSLAGSKIGTPRSRIPKPVLITFDDGYEGIYKHAYPVLKKHTFAGIIFITTGYIGKRNNWDASPGPRFKHLDWGHIREMADDGICIGSHGVNHTFLTRQSDNAARYEIEDSKKVLEDGLGRPIHFFSYPYGDYDNRIISFVREAGYEAAFSLRPGLLKAEYGSTGAIHNIYTLPRIAIYLLDNMWAFKAKIGCIRSGSIPYMQKAKNRLINRCAYASMLVERLRS